jgi:hypothetical protein
MATVRDFIRQLQKLPQDAQVLIHDGENQCLLPPAVRTLDDGAVEIVAPSRLGDRTARSGLSRWRRHVNMEGSILPPLPEDNATPLLPETN